MKIKEKISNIVIGETLEAIIFTVGIIFLFCLLSGSGMRQ